MRQDAPSWYAMRKKALCSGSLGLVLNSPGALRPPSHQSLVRNLSSKRSYQSIRSDAYGRDSTSLILVKAHCASSMRDLAVSANRQSPIRNWSSGFTAEKRVSPGGGMLLIFCTQVSLPKMRS